MKLIQRETHLRLHLRTTAVCDLEVTIVVKHCSNHIWVGSQIRRENRFVVELVIILIEAA